MIYLINMIIISIFCAGLYKASEPGMLLGGLSLKWDRFTSWNNQQSWLYTITLGCVYCYASFWGTVLYWTLMLWVWDYDTCREIAIMWPITCVSCVFLNGLLYQILNRYEISNKTIPKA